MYSCPKKLQTFLLKIKTLLHVHKLYCFNVGVNMKYSKYDSHFFTFPLLTLDVFDVSKHVQKLLICIWRLNTRTLRLLLGMNNA